jgi:hypothetical protein
MTSQTITWKSAADKPDDDTTLLPLTHAASEPVRLGDPDGDTWHFIDGMTGAPTHRADIPAGPWESAGLIDDLHPRAGQLSGIFQGFLLGSALIAAKEFDLAVDGSVWVFANKDASKPPILQAPGFYGALDVVISHIALLCLKTKILACRAQWPGCVDRCSTPSTPDTSRRRRPANPRISPIALPVSSIRGSADHQ